MADLVALPPAMTCALILVVLSGPSITEIPPKAHRRSGLPADRVCGPKGGPRDIRCTSTYCFEFSGSCSSTYNRHMAEQENRAAAALSRLGAKKGGVARAAKLTPAQRSESARKAVQARWAKAKGGSGHMAGRASAGGTNWAPRRSMGFANRSTRLRPIPRTPRTARFSRC